MSRLKGWKKKWEKNDSIEWINRQNTHTIFLGSYYPYGYDNYCIVSIGKIGDARGVVRRRFDNKNKAIKFAISWMRTHPNG